MLTIGIIFILIPIMMSLLMVLQAVPLPIYVPTPTVNGTDSQAELARVTAEAFPLYNVIPTFLLLVILVYGGSVLMGKGVGLIKEINWKVEKLPEKETQDIPTPEPNRSARKAKEAQGT